MHLQVVRYWRDSVAIILLALCMSVHAAPEEKAVRDVQGLNEQARKLYDQGRYQEAKPLAQRAVEISEKELGLVRPETAGALDTLAQVHRAMGAYAQAEPLYQRALAIREKVLGLEHPTTAASLHNLGILYYTTVAYAKAEPLYQRALVIYEKALGPTHPETADLLNSLANLYSDTGAYAKAEPLYQRALAICEKALAPEHPKTADLLNNLAVLYFDTGAYTKAESLNQRALVIRRKALGPEHLKTADSLTNLASLYVQTSAYDKAGPLYQQALAIHQKALGSEHPTTANSLDGLAVLYSLTGAYAKAEPLYQRALGIRQKALGLEHPKTADSLNNLAILYKNTGAYTKAESLYQRALAIYQKALGPEHPQTADSLHNLAVLYAQTGAYTKAEPLYQQALAIRQKALGPEHQNTADSLDDLAKLYSATGAYAKAERLTQRALAIYEKSLGPEHPDTAISLSNLAALYVRTGAYTKAVPLYQRALAIYEKALGPEHPDTAHALNDLASLYSATGAYAKAERLYQRAQVIQARNSERFLLTGSESRKQAYLKEIEKNTHRNVSLSVSVRSHGSISLGLTGVLQYKGRVLDEVSGSVARLRQSVKPADRELFDQLAQVANEFSTLTYRGFGSLSPAQYQQRLDELSQRQEALEADLARCSAEFRRQITPVTIAAVGRAIPKAAVLIEWFRYRPFDPRKTGPKTQQGSPRYVAYVLRAGGEPSLVDLGDAQVIETSVREFLKAVQDPASSEVKAWARGLSDKIVKPFRAYLNGAERILVSPDGILNLVPMAALLDENDQYLVQRYETTYLTSGRDVLRMAAVSGSQNGAIVIANPDYGPPTRLLAATEPLGETQRSAELDRSGIVFRPLPNTVTEARTLKSLLKLDDSSVLTGLKATESTLKQLRGPRILHIASHGFFLKEQALAELGPSAKQAIHNGENPLLRAGIALAGANTRRSGKSDDGILTALEAAQLDLRGTELVVLSACETGIGQVQNGEGVYGLRRALFIAGAQTQITSLWRVADKATATLMVDYYHRLLNGQGRSAALREAQLKMLATPQRSHPYWWASYIPIGDWAPLRAKRQ